MNDNIWEKVSRSIGLYRYVSSGRYFAQVRFKGTLDRTDPTQGNKSFAAVLDDYGATLIGAQETVEDKRVIIDKLKTTLFGAEHLPLRLLKPSQIEAWLATHYGSKSASYYNAALMLVRDALQKAVRDRVIAENPARDLKYR